MKIHSYANPEDVDKETFFKYGYCVIRNFLNSEEVKKYTALMDKLHAKKNSKEVAGLHNRKEFWDLIAHKKILDTYKRLLGPEIRYLYGGATKKQEIGDVPYEWHRDTPCRIFNFGPDWDRNEDYNVVRMAFYLGSTSVKSGMNIIPFTHKKRYMFSSLLRLIHYKTKDSNNSFVKMIRRNLEKFIGINILTNPGDCVIFPMNVMHTGIPPKGGDARYLMVLAYGTDNIHAQNYVNYSVKHRSSESAPTIEDAGVEDLKQFLKSNNIYYPIPKEKIYIEGIHMPPKY